MTNQLRVLIVDADWTIASLMAEALEDEGMTTLTVGSDRQAVVRKRLFAPHVVVIGLGASQTSPVDLVEAFSADRDCGVMVVSANDRESAHDDSLEHGADDFILEPIGLRRLVSRIKALHRRTSRPDPTSRRQKVQVDASKRGLVNPNGLMITLTEAEFTLLQTLLDAGGGPVTREQLGRAALRRALADDDRSVDQLVLKLRRKLVQVGLAERAILSTRGLGYSVPEPEVFETTTSHLPSVTEMMVARSLQGGTTQVSLSQGSASVVEP